MAGGSKKKGGGGNSHDRSMDRASQPPVLHVPESLVPAQSISAPERISRLVDSGITQMLAGIVGGLVGTFLDGRYFAALSFMVSFALNRSKALIGIRHRWILPIHAVSVAIAFAALFFMGKQLNKSKPQVYTPEDYANAVRAKLPLPITRQVTNVYNSYVSPEKELGQPRVDLSEFTPYDQGSRNLSLKSFISNGGTVTAEDVVSSQLVLLRVRGKQSEDELFDTLEKDKFNSLAPREDIAPGPPKEALHRRLILEFFYGV
jgi:hypothetical protein